MYNYPTSIVYLGRIRGHISELINRADCKL